MEVLHNAYVFYFQFCGIAKVVIFNELICQIWLLKIMEGTFFDILILLATCLNHVLEIWQIYRYKKLIFVLLLFKNSLNL
jgi:hypothetical protein